MKALCSRDIFVVMNLTSLRMSWNAAFLSGESTEERIQSQSMYISNLVRAWSIYCTFRRRFTDVLYIIVYMRSYMSVLWKYDSFYETAYILEY